MYLNSIAVFILFFLPVLQSGSTVRVWKLWSLPACAVGLCCHWPPTAWADDCMVSFGMYVWKCASTLNSWRKTSLPKEFWNFFLNFELFLKSCPFLYCHICLCHCLLSHLCLEFPGIAGHPACPTCSPQACSGTSLWGCSCLVLSLSEQTWGLDSLLALSSLQKFPGAWRLSVVLNSLRTQTQFHECI